MPDFIGNGSHIKNGINYSSGGGSSSAEEITYSNTESELEATNVQDAIDEVSADITEINCYFEDFMY